MQLWMCPPCLSPLQLLIHFFFIQLRCWKFFKWRASQTELPGLWPTWLKMIRVSGSWISWARCQNSPVHWRAQLIVTAKKPCSELWGNSALLLPRNKFCWILILLKLSSSCSSQKRLQLPVTVCVLWLSLRRTVARSLHSKFKSMVVLGRLSNKWAAGTQQSDMLQFCASLIWLVIVTYVFALVRKEASKQCMTNCKLMNPAMSRPRLLRDSATVAAKRSIVTEFASVVHWLHSYRSCLQVPIPSFTRR